MSIVREPTRDYIRVHDDSRRWAAIERRSDDIVISTPPKCGTTWTQGIVASLLWPDGDAPAGIGELSPWIDMQVTPLDDLVAMVAAQSHRRFLKSHSPGDCIPLAEDGRYIVVYRDGRDALVSWSNHRARMRPEVMEIINRAAAINVGLEPLANPWDGDMDVLFDEWSADCSPTTHLASWWPLRDEPFVLFVHYNDLLADLRGEMRRIADFLDLEVSDEQWPTVVGRCHIDSMRSAADEEGHIDFAFVGGASSFFNQGVNGRWEGILSDRQLERYAEMVAQLPDDAAAWLEWGSLGLGRRPDGATV